MKLRELLSELRRNILRDASTATSGNVADGALWDDETLILYIRDAEEKFAAGTLCLRDSRTPALTQIALEAGVSEYPVDKRVIAVYAVQYDGKINLGKTTHGSRFGANADITPNAPTGEPQGTGEPRLYYTDRDSGYIGVYPIPTAEHAGKLLRLQVARRPVNPLNRNVLDAEPEVPDEYHLDLLEWATWRALRNHDADIDGDPANISIVMARSSSHKKRFDEAVAECKRKNKYMNTQHVEFGVRANWS